MSKTSLILLIVTATIILVANHVSSQPPTQPTFQYILCNFELGSYSGYSPYEANLRAVLSTLQQQASTSDKFYSTSSATDPETVYGQYYCRGDISTDLCGACIGEAAQEALNTCGQAKGAIVWYEECTLRYSNQSIYGILDVDDQHPYSIAYSSVRVSSSDPNMFYVALNDTMTTLIEEAVSTYPFATGEGKVYGSDLTLYCLVQCSPELSRAQCDTCLQSIYSDTLTCCGQWPASLYAFYPSCQVMFNAEAAFYYSIPGTPGAPPAPFLASPPTSSPPPPPSPPLPPPSPSSTVSQPPPPSVKPPSSPPPPTPSPSSSTVSQPPSPATLGAPPPSTYSQQPSSSFTAPPPLTASQPPPSLNGGATIVTRESMKVWIVTGTLLILMLVLNP